MNEAGVLPPLGYSVLMTLEQGVLIGQESGILMALCCRNLMIPVLRGVVEGLLSKLN